MAVSHRLRRVGGPARRDVAARMKEDPFERTAPWRSRWDQERAEFVATDSEWCDRLAARLIAIVPGVDYLSASHTAVDLAADDALRALAPEWVAEDLARAQVGL